MNDKDLAESKNIILRSYQKPHCHQSFKLTLTKKIFNLLFPTKLQLKNERSIKLNASMQIIYISHLSWEYEFEFH